MMQMLAARERARRDGRRLTVTAMRADEWDDIEVCVRVCVSMHVRDG